MYVCSTFRTGSVVFLPLGQKQKQIYTIFLCLIIQRSISISNRPNVKTYVKYAHFNVNYNIGWHKLVGLGSLTPTRPSLSFSLITIKYMNLVCYISNMYFFIISIRRSPPLYVYMVDFTKLEHSSFQLLKCLPTQYFPLLRV